MTDATPLASEQITQDDVIKALTAALDHYERNVCTHEDTHRGGFLWTICDSCGSRWADDEGGFVPFAYPPEIENAHKVLAALSASPAPSGQGVSGEVREAFRAGWWVNAATPGEDGAGDQDYFEKCERFDWGNYISASAVAMDEGDTLDGRPCTCDPADRPEECQRRFAATECQFAAPAPSCAPGEVERLRDTSTNDPLMDALCEFEAGDASIWETHDAILAALSPQGLDAKEGGE